MLRNVAKRQAVKSQVTSILSKIHVIDAICKTSPNAKLQKFPEFDTSLMMKRGKNRENWTLDPLKIHSLSKNAKRFRYTFFPLNKKPVFKKVKAAAGYDFIFLKYLGTIKRCNMLPCSLTVFVKFQFIDPSEIIIFSLLLFFSIWSNF